MIGVEPISPGLIFLCWQLLDRGVSLEPARPAPVPTQSSQIWIAVRLKQIQEAIWASYTSVHLDGRSNHCFI